MRKIDVSEWKEFAISNIFQTEKRGSKMQVPTGGAIQKKELEDGSTPRITVSGTNNGIIGYFKDVDDKNYRVYENFISVSFLGTVFYQNGKASLDMKVHCLKPLKHELNKYSGIFLVSIIRKTIQNFAYSDQLSSSVLAELTIPLPATPDGAPDWQYMEEYIRQLLEESEAAIGNLRQLKEKKKVDMEGWKEFRVRDIYEPQKVKHKLSKADLESDGEYPCFSSETSNNGILGYNNNPEFHLSDEKVVYIIFGDHTRSFNIATTDFSVLDNVKVLKPITNSIEALMFINTIWKKSIPDLGYARHWSVAKDIKLLLPATPDGKPDYDFMESYIKGMMEKTADHINILN